MLLLYLYIILFLLKVVHEFGHFLAAKFLGIVCSEFRIGKGPKLFEVRLGKTLLAFCLVPLGCKAVFQDNAYKPNFLKNAMVILAGPLMNVVAAAIIMIVVAGTFNIYSTEAIIGKVHSLGSAEIQGIHNGDRVLSINNRPVNSWEDLQNEIQNNENDKFHFILERDGETVTADVVSPSNLELIDSLSPSKTRSPVQAVKFEVKMTYGYVESLFILFTNEKTLDEELSGPIRIRPAVDDQISYLKLGLIYAALLSNLIALLSFLPFPPFDGWRLVATIYKGARQVPS